MNGKKILIVDDNQIILRALSRKIESSGYIAFTALDPAEGVAAVRREKPDLIVLDINFPPDVAHGGGVFSDGFQMIPWLRRMDEAKDTPIIIITGAQTTNNKDRALQEGACAFFQKPVDHEQLFAAIREALHEEAAPNAQE